MVRLGRIEPASAELQTLVHRHAAGLAFKADGRSWRHEAGRANRAGATLYGRVGGAEVCVWLAEEGWRIAAAGVLDVPPHEIDAFPEPLVRASLESFASGIFAAVQRGIGLPVEATRLELGDAVIPGAACRFGLVAGDGLRIEGAWLVFGDATAAFEAIRRALSALPVRQETLPDELPVAVRVCLAAWRMPLTLLKTLEPGDVVLSPSGAELCVVAPGGVRFAARVQSGVLSVEGKTMTQEGIPGEPGADAAQEPVSLDAIEVDVLAVAGRMTMTLGQLRQLGEGQIVEFATPVTEPAQLVVCGRTVATGELVEVGGRVGVRVIEAF